MVYHSFYMIDRLQLLYNSKIIEIKIILVLDFSTSCKILKYRKVNVVYPVLEYRIKLLIACNLILLEKERNAME